MAVGLWELSPRARILPHRVAVAGVASDWREAELGDGAVPSGAARCRELTGLVPGQGCALRLPTLWGGCRCGTVDSGLGWSAGLEEKPRPIPSRFRMALGDPTLSWGPAAEWCRSRRV